MQNRTVAMLKVVVWACCLAPLAKLIWGATHSGLGANPVERITLGTGLAALIILLASLAVTPLRRITGWNWLIRFRRLLGLFAFFYIVLHFIIYLVLDREFDIGSVAADIAKRPFITMGMLAFFLLIPLAATSTAWSIRKLGGKRWSRLHKLVYAAAVAAVLHFWWKEKADISEPAMYAAILAVLFAVRIFYWLRGRKPIAA